MTALEYKMRNEKLEMRNVSMQCHSIAFNQKEALRSNANLNYSSFIIHHSSFHSKGVK
jgi:hypothetical protein